MKDDITPEIINSIYKCVVEATKSSNELPKLGDNYELYASYPIFAEFLKNEGDRILQLITNIYRFSDAKVNFTNTKILDELCERLEKANDVVSERLANCIDEAEGRRKQDDLIVIGKEDNQGKYQFINTSWNKRLHLLHDKNDDQTAGSSISADKTASSAENNPVINLKSALLLASKNVIRPQIQFQKEIDNSNRPFVSKLKIKHNAKERPKSHLKMVVDDLEVDDMLQNSDVSESDNPYKYELDHFEPCSWQMEQCSCLTVPEDVDQTEVQFIETEDQLEKLVSTLKNCYEFAVDLEHHSYRSFLGITCLMQISTRRYDYIIDTLKLWRHMHKLNDPFTDSKILKVFHGADRDIEWLQRDFGIYLVNVFDTGQAMRILGMPRFSLAYLIKHYFNRDLDKQFQLADWRIRPLPEQLIRYAREDTHYLLHCYDRLKNDLLENGNEQKNLLTSVYERSRDLCLTHYQKPLLYEDDYLDLLAKSKKTFNSRQDMALKHLYVWRDKLARLEDESLAYVLPNHMLMQIAEVLPREMHGVLACCNPVPPLVRRELQELHRIVLHARESPLESLSKATVVQTVPVRQVRAALGVRPHDYTHSAENEDIIPLSQRIASVINKRATVKQTSANLLKNEPCWFVLFDYASPVQATCDQPQQPKKKKRNRNITTAMDEYTTPYDLYMKAKIAEELRPRRDENALLPETSTDSVQAKNRKLYSHLTPTVNESSSSSSGVVHASEENADVVVVPDDNDDDNLFAEPAQKRKKRRGKNVSFADIKPFDYESASAAQENLLKQTDTPSSSSKQGKKRFFDPDGEFLSKGKGWKKKKFGGGRPSKTSYFKSKSAKVKIKV